MPKPKPLAQIAAEWGDIPAPTRSPEEIERAREEATRKLLAEAFARDNLARWEMACPPELQETNWDDPRLAAYRDKIDQVLNYKLGPKGILASGRTGRGKSRSMWALMRRLGVAEGVSCRYWQAHDFFADMGAQIKYGNDDAGKWVKAVASPRVVFIDDFGQEAVQKSRGDWSRGWFFKFCDIRVGAGLPLFITTNLSSDEIVAREGDTRGDPLVRRLLELCEPVKFGHK